MPGPIVIPNCYRVTLLWDALDGVAPRNVLNIHSEGVGASEAHVGSLFWDNATSNMFGVMPTLQALSRVLVQKYDGVSAGIIVTGGPLAGESSTQPIPAACQLVSLRTTTRGPKGRGRVYVGPVCEGNQNAGVIDATTTAFTEGAWNAFAAALNLDVVASSGLVVASRKHLAAYPVTTISVEGPMATQRRRQDQVRP